MITIGWAQIGVKNWERDKSSFTWVCKLSCTRAPSHGFEIQPTVFSKPSNLICKEGRLKGRGEEKGKGGREGDIKAVGRGRKGGREKEEPGGHGGRGGRLCPVGWVCSQGFCFTSFLLCERIARGGLESLFRICVSNYSVCGSTAFSSRR